VESRSIVLFLIKSGTNCWCHFSFILDKDTINLIKSIKIETKRDYIKILEAYKLNNKNKSLAVTHPAIAKEWHPSKNGKLKPQNFTYGSNVKVWWKCSKGHEWQTTVNNRYSQNKGCPYCYGRFATEENCLLNVNPNLAKQWHPIKNGALTPRDVKPNSGKKVWWLCPEGHEWEAVIQSRNKGNNCPYCARKKRTI
jgi:Probable Zinc-ribbon domain